MDYKSFKMRNLREIIRYQGLKCRSTPKKSEVIFLIEEDNKAKQLDESQQYEELEKMRCEKVERLRLENEERKHRRYVDNKLQELWRRRDEERKEIWREIRFAKQIGVKLREDIGFSD